MVGSHSLGSWILSQSVLTASPTQNYKSNKAKRRNMLFLFCAKLAYEEVPEHQGLGAPV